MTWKLFNYLTAQRTLKYFFHLLIEVRTMMGCDRVVSRAVDLSTVLAADGSVVFLPALEQGAMLSEILIKHISIKLIIN